MSKTRSSSTKRRKPTAKVPQAFDTFINAVLDPLPAETLVDTQYNSLLRDARRDAWHQAYTSTRYFKALWEYTSATQSYYEYVEKKEIPAEVGYHLNAALLASYRAAIVRQILTPAPNMAEVIWKRSAAAGPCLPIAKGEAEAAIAADEAFLAAHPVRRCRSKVEG